MDDNNEAEGIILIILISIVILGLVIFSKVTGVPLDEMLHNFAEAAWESEVWTQVD